MNQTNTAPRAPVLKAVDKIEADEAAAIAGFGAAVFPEVDEDYTPPPINYAKDDPKTLVSRARKQAQEVLDGLTHQKAEAEAKMAAAERARKDRLDAAQRAYETEQAGAKTEYDTAMWSIQADLEQITACKEGFDMLVGRLNKASD